MKDISTQIEELQFADYCKGVLLQCENEKEAQKRPLLEQLVKQNAAAPADPTPQKTPGSNTRAMKKVLEEINEEKGKRW